jgi:23S rRNA (guanine745-N1)-methyltransferase
MQFCCPIDGLDLEPSSHSLKCARGHSFDLAREGYCNLLLVQQKASMNPGDNPEMVNARRRFLEAGYYEPVAEKTAEFARALGSTRVLDAGCGEGYYLHHLQKILPGAELAGTDISKAAVKAAAKKYKGIAWAVASNRQLPFAPGSVDLLLSLFGFPIWESFKKIQAEGSHVLLVDPGPDHLRELREIIYAEVKTNDLASIREAGAAGYQLVKEEALEFSFHLPSAASIQDLLAMTPHGYRMNAEGRERVSRLTELTTRASVVFRLLRLGS